jgi:hypothetical protein
LKRNSTEMIDREKQRAKKEAGERVTRCMLIKREA